MLTASNNFHYAAVQANPDERILFAFGDYASTGVTPTVATTVMLWTGADVNARSPVRIVESINPNSELSIGQAPSATLDCEIFNEHGQLTHYLTQEAYTQDCAVFLGVKTASEAVQDALGDANCFAYVRDPIAPASHGVCITGHSTAPYLRVDGAAMPLTNELPSSLQWPVKALIIDNNAMDGGAYILALGEYPGQYYAVRWEFGNTWDDVANEYSSWGAWESSVNNTWGYSLGEGTYITFSTSYWNYFYKFPQLAKSGSSYSRVDYTLYETSVADHAERTWEYLPVGVFRMNAPTMLDEYCSVFSAYDKMTLFDKDITDFLDDLTYPITLARMLYELCEYCGVVCGMSGSESVFLNASMQITARPELRSGATGRTLLQHIAEAAGANAKMSRTGSLMLEWVNATPSWVVNPNPSFPGFTAVFETGIASYSVSQIDGLVFENTTETITVGTGTNPYRMTANPLLQDDSSATVTSRITPIYNRLSAFPTFRPSHIRCLSDWSLEAGDSVNFWYIPAGSSEYSPMLLPLYTITLNYNGVATSVYENRGSATRPADAYAYGATQQQFAAQRAQTKALVAGEETKAANNYVSKTGNAYRAASIPFGQVDSTSTSKVFTATISGITELRDGVCAYIRNGVVTSAKNFTLDINGLGAKPVYQTMADASRVSTAFNIAYTMLFVYNSSRVSGGCWDMFYGYNTNTTYTNMSLGNGYGTCDTSTAAATVTLGNFALKVGGYISVNFTNALPASATLNVNSTGAKAVYFRGAAIAAGDIAAGDTATFIYDGTNYVLIANDRWGVDSGGRSSGVAYITCSTPAATAAKTATATGVTQASGTMLAVQFANGNSAETPTFALNSGSSLPLTSCYTNAAISSGAITTGMTALLLCSGSAWVLLNPRTATFLANQSGGSSAGTVR